MTRLKQSGLPSWTWPALWFDGLRPGLAEWVARDVDWLARFPVAVRSRFIPGAVIAIPLLFAAARAFDPARPIAEVFTFRIIDVYIESIPYMVIAAAIGMAAPTLGVLFLAAHMVGDLAAASVQQSELRPLPTALLARLLSFWLLYLLVAELPIAVHELCASMRKRVGRVAGGPLTLAVGAASATVLAFIWGVAAPLLIRPVFTWSALGKPTANAGTPLLVAPDVFALSVGALTLVGFALRYLAFRAPSEPITVVPSSPRSGAPPLVFAIVVPILLFSSVITQPIDALVLATAVLGARPIGSLVLRRTGLARPLAIIPRPVRLLGGVALAAVVGFVIATVLGVSTLSSFFTMNVVMAVSFVLIRILLDADDFAETAAPGPSPAAGVAASIASGAVIWLFSAGWAFADDIANQGDGYGAALAAAVAAAAAGGLAAASANSKNKGASDKQPPIEQLASEFISTDIAALHVPDPGRASKTAR